MREITATDFNGPYDRETNRYPQVTVDVRVARWTGERRNVYRSDNGRLLGWIARGDNGRGFEARVNEYAFHGDGQDDEGHLLDKVPGHLTNKETRFKYAPVSIDARLDGAVYDLISHLVRHHAPAVGYGRHPLVERYEDRRRCA